MSPLTEPTKLVLKKDPVLADPYYHNVSLLLHGDGANGSTTIIDSSPTPKTVTAVGDAQISTAQSKFGGASIGFSSSNSYLTCSQGSALDFGLNDFTLEFWFYSFRSSGYDGIIGKGASDNEEEFTLLISRTEIYFDRSGSSSEEYFTVAVATNANEWNYYAMTRQGTNLRFFLNGQLLKTSALTAAITNNFSSFNIGRARDGSVIFNGYIDDLRITKGVARYTSNFTPPTAPFPEVIG